MLESELQKKCLNRLSNWPKSVVVYYTDLSQFGVRYIRGHYVKRTTKGLPDIVAYIKHNDTCALCWFELKTGTKQSVDQVAFMLKFKDLTNVYYDVVTSVDQMCERIEDITGYYKKTLDNMSI